MVKDFLVSFSDNFKERVKNPLLGTYLLVWLVRNWDLIYSLFNFDSNLKLKDKIGFVNNYFKKTDFVENLLINIYWAFGLLILTYLLVNASRFIVNLSEKQLTPWIYKITDSKSIVLKNEYERIRSQSDDMQVRLDNEREAKSRLEFRIKNLENELIEIGKSKKSVSADEMLKSELQNNTTKTQERTDILITKLKAKNLQQDFLNTYLGIQQGDTLNSTSETTKFFLQIGLIQYQGNYSGNEKYYVITDDGKKIVEKLRLEI